METSESRWVARARMSRSFARSRCSGALRLFVAYVAEAAEEHRSRKQIGPVWEARAELTKHADEALPAEGVDLVEQEHDRSGALPRPGVERGVQARSGGRIGPGSWMELWRQRGRGTHAKRLEEDELDRAEVVASGFASLAGDVYRRVAARGRQLPAERSQRGGLACLPRRVDDEVGVLFHEAWRLGEPARGGDHAVEIRTTRPGRVEPALHRDSLDLLGTSRQGRRPPKRGRFTSDSAKPMAT